MTLRNILAVVAGTLGAAALTGCGGSGGTPASGPTAATPSPATRHPGASAPPATGTPVTHATEFNPPGDIPDNQVFVDFRVPGSVVHIRVPEGWARRQAHGVTTFTDHYNSIAIQVVAAPARPSVASASTRDVPALRRSVPRFANPHVGKVTRQHGSAVLITYLLDSAPNDVTGKVVRDAAERYEFWQHGREAVLTLTGPRNADNVDPWRTVSDSLQWK